MFAESGQSIGQNVSLPWDICYLMEHDILDIAQDSEMLGIGYLYEVFLIHLDQPFAVAV